MMAISNWINSHLLWLVDVIARMGLKGQLILTAVIIAAVAMGNTLKENRDGIEELLGDDEPFDATWMDYDEWLNTRPERREK